MLGKIRQLCLFKLTTLTKKIRTITLTTDLGLKDYYVAAIKGSILMEINEIHIIDISHDIEKFNIAQAAFMLKNVIHDFEDGTIHIIGVRPSLENNVSHLAIEYKNQFFIGADNGIFSLIFEFPPEKVVELNLTQDNNLLTFPTKDVFVKAACHIARGGTLEVIGKPVESINEKHSFMAVIGSDSIRGSVVYIDSYGNVISNITERLFVEVGKGRSFTIMFRKRGDEIHQISELYTDVAEGEKLALFGSTGMLEIAMNIGHAKNLLGFNENDIVNIEFHDN